MKKVPAGKQRHCPHCKSDKWTWLEAVPITIEELQHHMLHKYKCNNCKRMFEVEEKAGTKWVESANRCFNCNSPNIEKLSNPGSDIRLYRCKQCNGFMGIRRLSEKIK
jgi:hypothetical protein